MSTVINVRVAVDINVSPVAFRLWLKHLLNEELYSSSDFSRYSDDLDSLADYYGDSKEIRVSEISS